MKSLNIQSVGKRKQSGFTIIELVVVILLLGILTATALPRFMDVTDEAHDAVVAAVEGGLVTTGALFHAQWIAEGEDAEGTVLTDFGDGTMQTSAEGYPVGLGTDPANLDDEDANDDTACVNLFDRGLQAGHPTVAVSPTENLEPASAALIDAATTDFLAWNVDGTSVCSYAYVAEGSAAANEIITFDIETGETTSNTTTTF